MKTLEDANKDFGKFGKRLGGAGLVLTAANLTYKYYNGGITRKDAFDAIVSGGLLDVLKGKLGIDDTIIYKNDDSDD